MVSAVPQVLDTTGAAGAAGKTTKALLPTQPLGGVYVMVKQPAEFGVNTPDEFILPPPDTLQEPPTAPPVCENVTVPPFMQALLPFMVGPPPVTVTVGSVLSRGTEVV